MIIKKLKIYLFNIFETNINYNMGAGILPVCFNGVSLLFLLGKEQNNEWSDFGGSSNSRYESTFHTAIREGYEETNGLLGNKYELGLKVKNNYILDYSNHRYTTHLFKINYDNNLPLYYNNNFNFIKNNYPQIIKEKNNGLYEKKEIDWFQKKQIYDLNLRPFYKKIIYPILDREKEIIESLKKIEIL